MRCISSRYRVAADEGLTDQNKAAVKDFYGSVLAVQRFLNEKRKQLAPEGDLSGFAETFRKFYDLVNTHIEGLENAVESIIEPKVEQMTGEPEAEPMQDVMKAIEDLPSAKKPEEKKQ